MHCQLFFSSLKFIVILFEWQKQKDLSSAGFSSQIPMPARAGWGWSQKHHSLWGGRLKSFSLCLLPPKVCTSRKLESGAELGLQPRHSSKGFGQPKWHGNHCAQLLSWGSSFHDWSHLLVAQDCLTQAVDKSLCHSLEFHAAFLGFVKWGTGWVIFRVPLVCLEQHTSQTVRKFTETLGTRQLHSLAAVWAGGTWSHKLSGGIKYIFQKET